MPESLQQEFRSLRRDMYAVKALPDEAEPTAAIRKMSAAQAGQHAITIMKLTFELQALCLSHDNRNDSESQQLVFGRDVIVPERLN